MNIIDVLLLPFQIVWWIGATLTVYSFLMLLVVGGVMFVVWLLRKMWLANKGIEY